MLSALTDQQYARAWPIQISQSFLSSESVQTPQVFAIKKVNSLVSNKQRCGSLGFAFNYYCIITSLPHLHGNIRSNVAISVTSGQWTLCSNDEFSATR